MVRFLNNGTLTSSSICFGNWKELAAVSLTSGSAIQEITPWREPALPVRVSWMKRIEHRRFSGDEYQCNEKDCIQRELCGMNSKQFIASIMEAVNLKKLLSDEFSVALIYDKISWFKSVSRYTYRNIIHLINLIMLVVWKDCRTLESDTFGKSLAKGG